MITDVDGDLFAEDVDAIVNPVNVVGVMGKGLALAFKRAFPENFAAYERACDDGTLAMGRVFAFDRGVSARPRWIVNFPTKRHFRDKSKVADIESGLVDLERVIRETGVTSIAIPALGCGLGGLDWAAVRPVIATALEPLAIDVRLFPPRD